MNAPRISSIECVANGRVRHASERCEHDVLTESDGLKYTNHVSNLTGLVNGEKAYIIGLNTTWSFSKALLSVSNLNQFNNRAFTKQIRIISWHIFTLHLIFVAKPTKEDISSGSNDYLFFSVKS